MAVACCVTVRGHPYGAALDTLSHFSTACLFSDRSARVPCQESRDLAFPPVRQLACYAQDLIFVPKYLRLESEISWKILWPCLTKIQGANWPQISFFFLNSYARCIGEGTPLIGNNIQNRSVSAEASGYVVVFCFFFLL